MPWDPADECDLSPSVQPCPASTPPQQQSHQRGSLSPLSPVEFAVQFRKHSWFSGLASRSLIVRVSISHSVPANYCRDTSTYFENPVMWIQVYPIQASCTHGQLKLTADMIYQSHITTWQTRTKSIDVSHSKFINQFSSRGVTLNHKWCIHALKSGKGIVHTSPFNPSHSSGI